MFGWKKKEQQQVWLNTFHKPELTALAAMANNISRVAVREAEGLKPYIQGTDEKARKDRWFLVLCEFLYFFMHMANRAAYKELGHSKRCKFQDELYPLIVRPNIEAVFSSWPSNLKDRIEQEFTEKLGAAEIEYGACKQMLDRDNPLSQNALFSKFASNVCELIEAKKSDPTTYSNTFMKVIDLTLNAFKELNLPETITAVGKEL